MNLLQDVRRTAESTPANRDRHVDLLRAAAITVVVLGHWTAVAITTEDGLDGKSALSDLPWAHPVTWMLQVMPIFFLVGGFANGASLSSHQRRGGDAAGWLLHRATRLLPPTTAFLVLLALAGLVLRLLGVGSEGVAVAVWAASLPLWFLAAYIGLTFLAPSLWAAHRRFGFAVPAVAGGVILLLDVARLRFDVPLVANVNHLLVWLVFFQLGFAWQSGRLPPRPWILGAAAGAGIGLLIFLTTIGPYPVSMVAVPGAELQNTAPPTFALLVLGLVQTALVLLLAQPLRRFLRRPGPWTVVVAVNAVILTMFLWHMVAAVIAAVALYPTGVMPEPAVDSADWLLLRLPWLMSCGVILAVLISVFARLEVRSGSALPRRAADAPVPTSRLNLSHRGRHLAIGAGIAGVVGGLVTIAAADRSYEGVAGLPTSALILYLTGTGLLWLAQHIRALRDPSRE